MILNGMPLMLASVPFAARARGSWCFLDNDLLSRSCVKVYCEVTHTTQKLCFTDMDSEPGQGTSVAGRRSGGNYADHNPVAGGL
jgi:hypothetical protein